MRPEAHSLPVWVPNETLDNIERREILNALTYYEGNRTHAAFTLGISIRTMRNKLVRYKLLGFEVPKAPRRTKRGSKQ